MAEFLFGEIDVLLLEDDTSTPPPFDVSRSVKLNPDNDLVKTLYSFIGPNLEQVRRVLVEAHREHKANEALPQTVEHVVSYSERGAV